MKHIILESGGAPMTGREMYEDEGLILRAMLPGLSRRNWDDLSPDERREYDMAAHEYVQKKVNDARAD